LRPGGVADRKRSGDVEFGLPDALTASTYASVNAAYIYPRYMTFHELFMVGAWLGNLLRGRPALMPIPVAEYVLERAEGKSTASSCEWVECEALVRLHMALVGGAKSLVRTARRVRANGYSGVVRPRGEPVRLGRFHVVWNRALRDYIDSRLPQASG
jgi:hypothetical protein